MAQEWSQAERIGWRCAESEGARGSSRPKSRAKKAWVEKRIRAGRQHSASQDGILAARPHPRRWE